MAGAHSTQVPGPSQAPDWPASRLIHRPVVHTQLTAQVGEVADIVFSSESRQVIGLLVGPPAVEGGLLELMRRLLGMDLWLTFVPTERVLALHGDAVMIDTEGGRGFGWLRPLPPVAIRNLPRLRASSGFPVLTMQGQRLGAFVDLQLDAHGRRIKGYVISRPAAQALAVAPGINAATMPAPQASAPGAPPSQPAPTQPASAPAAATPVAPPPDRFMIPARFRVRFGRGLIVVGEDVSRPVVPQVPGEATEWPAPAWVDEAREPSTRTAPPATDHPSEPPASPDAPTEQLSPPTQS